MQLRLVVGLVAALSSTVVRSSPARAGRPPPPGAPATAALRGTVLVWHDAAFLTAPRDDAPAIHLATLAGPRQDQLGAVVPMRVLSTQGAFVEVEPAAAADCTGSRLEASDELAHLRLFVRRGDLAPVLTQPFATTFADGTKLTLKAGLPVLAADDGWFAVTLHGDEVMAPIPQASVGHAYASVRARPGATLGLGTGFALAPATQVTLGERAITIRHGRAAGVEAKGEITLFAIEDRCGAAVVAAPSRAVHPTDEEEEADDEVGGGGGLGTLALRDHDYLPIGTPLLAGGRQVAIAAKPIYLAGPARGKTVCIDRRLQLARRGPATAADHGPDPDDAKLHLCAAATKVVHERLRGAGSANGATGR
jgi:hypothetical protein